MNQKNPKQTNKQTNKKDKKSKKTSASTVQDASVTTSKKDENKTTERLAFRLNSLQDKKARFESHKSFLKSLFFLSATWQPHSQLWATVKVAASLTRCSSMRLLFIRPEGHPQLCNGVTVGFEPVSFRF